MNAWELTPEDIETVLKAHDVALPEEQVSEILGRLDKQAIIDGLLTYTDFDDQCQSALCDIESQLSQIGIIDSDACFLPPEN